MKVRVALGVALAWLAIALIWGVQETLGSAVTGGPAIPLATALIESLRQIVPWMLMTLAIIALALRFPLTRTQWPRHLPVHAMAAPAVAFLANVMVVLSYWVAAGEFRGFATLARQGAVWGIARLHVAVLIYVAILGITQAVLYYRDARARELHLARLEGQLAQARLQALQAQVRPHFLFNILHTIGQLWRSGRSDDAESVLDRLGTLAHGVLRSTSQIEVPLAQELELVRDYLAIEEVRFGDRLRPVVRAANDTLDCLVPSLILQPVVENAVRHGISAIGTAGVVEVTATRQDGILRLTVRDDGPGVRTRPVAPGSGMGLRNTRERLAQLYGTRGHLSIGDAAGGGTLVTIDIPASAATRSRSASPNVGSDG